MWSISDSWLLRLFSPSCSDVTHSSDIVTHSGDIADSCHTVTHTLQDALHTLQYTARIAVFQYMSSWYSH